MRGGFAYQLQIAQGGIVDEPARYEAGLVKAFRPSVKAWSGVRQFMSRPLGGAGGWQKALDRGAIPFLFGYSGFLVRTSCLLPIPGAGETKWSRQARTTK